MSVEVRAPGLSRSSRRILNLCLLLGVVVLATGSFLAPERLWPNVLIVAYYLLGLGLAGAFFVATQHLTGATWSVVFRRVPEAMTSVLVFGGLALMGVLLLRPGLYPWVQPSATSLEPGHAFSRAWFDLSFFRLRAIVFLVLWIALALAMVRASLRQDVDHDPGCGRRAMRYSALFVVVFGLTFWLASFDWIMSLDPHWYSTIFGIYNFCGLFLAGLAAITLLTVWLRASGPLRGIVTAEHLHDLGKLLFAFSTLWMYIWFSQYMLIWYANIPEETGWFITRLQREWQPLFLLNITLNWVIPFFVLLLWAAKRSAVVLAGISVCILLGRWLDLYLLIAPNASGNGPKFGIWEIGLIPAGVALFLIAFRRALARNSVIPLGDPRLEASLHHRQ